MMKKATLTFLFLSFSFFFIWKGIIPATTSLQTDFPNYYTASRLVLENADYSKFYDDAWFQQQMNRFGITEEGKFTPFPPLTALVLLPIGHFSPLVAKQLWTCCNLILLLLNVLLISKILKKGWQYSLFLFFLSGLALLNNFKFGQMYLLLALTITLGYFLYTENRKTLSGIMFGLMIPIKYFPLIYIVYFAFKKEWEVVNAALLTTFFLTVVGIFVLGFQMHVEFFQVALPYHLNGLLQDPFSASFQSWASLFRRFFMYDERYNTAPLYNSRIMFEAMRWVVIIIVSYLQYLLIRKFEHSLPKEKAFALSFAVVGIVGLYLSPATATYHFLILILPFALMVTYLGEVSLLWQCIFGIIFTAIGYIPYHIFKQFDAQGILTLCAYPRLWLLSALFFTMVIFFLFTPFVHKEQQFK